jgi:cadmium resistance protein CadD (predicted permease)
MSGIGKWNLGIGAVLLGVAVLCSVLNLIPAAVITGILGLLGIVVAGYDVLNNWLDRAQLRRRGARARRESESRDGR